MRDSSSRRQHCHVAVRVCWICGFQFIHSFVCFNKGITAVSTQAPINLPKNKSYFSCWAQITWRTEAFLCLVCVLSLVLTWVFHHIPESRELGCTWTGSFTLTLGDSDHQLTHFPQTSKFGIKTSTFQKLAKQVAATTAASCTTDL